jgi:hypothetical protein
MVNPPLCSGCVAFCGVHQPQSHCKDVWIFALMRCREVVMVAKPFDRENLGVLADERASLKPRISPASHDQVSSIQFSFAALSCALL